MEVNQTVNFFINGTPYRVDPKNDKTVFPESRLVDFIREKAGLTGTKFMCREGGCGACMVSIKTKNANGKTTIKAVNSCLIPLLSCDGLDISTIESLGNKTNGYHPIQQQMVKFSGTQCGFCTPGMIMNMYCLSENAKGSGVKSREIEDSLDGNICRCTGYRPILDAFKSLSTDCSEQHQKCNGEAKNNCNGDIEDVKCCQLQNGKVEHKSDSELQPNYNETLNLHLSTGEKWIKATSLTDVFSSINGAKELNLPFRVVAGNTSTGIFKNEGPFKVFIDIGRIPELSNAQFDSTNGITIGASVTLSKAILILRRASQVDGLQYAAGVGKHIRRIANTGVRNVGTIAGNLMIKHDHPDFPSDLFVVLEALGSKLEIASFNNSRKSLGLEEFMTENMSGCIIVSIKLPPFPRSYSFRSYKISRRFQNAHAYVNAGFLLAVERNNRFTVNNEPSLVFGGINPSFIHAENTEKYLAGKSLLDPSTIAGAMKILKSEIIPDESLTDGSVEYRCQLAQSLLYKCILSILGQNVKPELQSGGRNIQRNLTSGTQSFDTDESKWPINQPVKKVESIVQCSGEAEFANDLGPFKGELFASYVLSTVGNADIKSVDASEAMKLPGVVKFIQASDIPGENDYYVPIFPGTSPEEIFASKKVMYTGQPIGLILAETKEMASKASKIVRVAYENLQQPVLFDDTLLENIKVKGCEEMSSHSDKDPVSKVNHNSNLTTIKGTFSIGSQYHFHMETQTCICIPKEDGMDVFTPCQFVDFVQGGIAKALNVSNNSINITVRRLGGSYGSKATRTGLLATACAVGAYVTNRPVRLVLDLETNMEMIGKRVPYTGKYEVEVDSQGKIHSLKTNIFGDMGFNANDEDPGEVKSSMQNCYNAENWEVSTNKVLTNTAANTWCRAPGTTQGIALIENIMEHIAFTLKMDPMSVRFNNLLQAGHESLGSHGIKGPNFEGENIIPKMYEEVKQTACLEERFKLVEEHNKVNRWKKRGISVVPIKYTLPYLGLNYPVFVAIYKHDGTIAVCHGGAECGQGINTKVSQAVAHKFGVPMDKVKVKPYNNLVCANAAVTGGSWTSELCCYAAGKACDEILEKLKPVKQKLRPDTPWEQVIGLCGRMGIDLTASYMYNSEDPIKGYDIWAVNVTEIEVDILTGEYKIARVDILEDVGQSLNPEIDIGQIEGAVVFGLGLWSTEKLIFDKTTGKLLTNNTWTYKPPLVRDIPEDFRVTILKNSVNQNGVLGSKASGEPPLCTSVAVLFALKNAIIAARAEIGNTEWFELNGPVTPENILQLSLLDSSQFIL